MNLRVKFKFQAVPYEYPNLIHFCAYVRQVPVVTTHNISALEFIEKHIQKQPIHSSENLCVHILAVLELFVAAA